VIPAHEALTLPTAQLTEEQRDHADKLEEQIDKAVREHMRRNGLDMQVKQADPAVIAEVNQRLRAAGWGAVWNPIVDEHRLNKALRVIVGFSLNLFPSDDAEKIHLRTNLI
jgi:hypothetical protein